MDPRLRLLGDAICVLLCVVAAAVDLRSKRIPNTLTLPAIALGLLLAGLCGQVHLLAAAIGLALLGGLFALVALTGGVGWGDVKLMAAVGALLGWPLGSWTLVLYALLYTALVGGVLALLASLQRRKLGIVLKSAATFMFRSKRAKEEGKVGSGVAIPYGVAIALGTLWAVAGRYLPALLVG